MATKTLTLRAANTERKLYDAQIARLVREIMSGSKSLIGYYSASNPSIDGMTPNEFSEQCTATWNKLNDLIYMRYMLNNAVMKGNGGTPDPSKTRFVPVKTIHSLVRLEQEENLTIAQAIALKKYIGEKLKPMITDLLTVISDRLRSYNKTQERATAAMMSQLNSQYGPESTANAKSRLEYQESIKPQYEVKLLDPLKIQTLLEKARSTIEGFEATIDSLISHATETVELTIEF